MSTRTLGSLSISAEAIIDLHALNNEGGEGNQIQTRMVEVVTRDTDGSPRVESVNAISGDMFKHIQADHLYHIAQGDSGLPLCAGCARFNANRISSDESFRAFINGEDKKTAPNAVQVLDRLLTSCTIDDLEGNLITEGKQSTPRKSVVEFGWVVGRPDATRTGQYFHVKYNPAQRAQEDDRSSNQGQAIFYRPASSGVYALVCHLELGRIGYNDISQRYAIDAEQQLARHQALLRSVLYTFIRPSGAMRSTQLPHLVDIRGVVSWSADSTPAPTFSALNPDFVDQSERVIAALTRGQQQPALASKPFSSFADLSDVLAELTETSRPLRYAER
ncbi:DevR family CRISPR-associated autoregulator [Chloroflexia bacterium SDU3-3]|nr:DevR family CRISPR-associated autoregulator [Chloroflexia bacterium SDU3-3]